MVISQVLWDTLENVICCTHYKFDDNSFESGKYIGTTFKDRLTTIQLAILMKKLMDGSVKMNGTLWVLTINKFTDG